MAREGADNLMPSPASAPALLRGHPALLVEWLRFVNALSRLREKGGRAAVLASSVIGIAAVLLWTLSSHAAAASVTLARHWQLVSAIAAVYAWTTVSRRRRAIQASQSRSWLSAAPISASSLRLSLAVRTLFPVVLTWIAACIVAASVAMLNQITAVGTVVVTLSTALSIGSVAGWWLGGRPSKEKGAVASRYVPHPRTRRPSRSGRAAAAARGSQSWIPRPDASALARWPIAQVLSWSRPENARYVLIVALFAVQGGSSALAGLSVVAMYFVASYLGALLSAMTTVARSAASWLRSTPMTLGTFVWSLARCALLHQLIGTAVAVGCMLLLGAPLSMAMQLAALWLGMVISVSGCALVENYRGRSPATKIVLSLATLAAIATLLPLRAGGRV